MTDSIDRLYNAVVTVRGSDPAKVAHGAAAARRSRQNDLVVLWVHAGVHPNDVWAEMRRREKMFGIAEKLPKHLVQGVPRRKVAAKETKRVGKRR